ncbi:uncharacterized protein LOC141651343 [Silene latifolia]|uniref:uncharacterized protein LOC141651343 n=1 Tax=Silene latifolia TaxID=37657 RepID=UPI003D789464
MREWVEDVMRELDEQEITVFILGVWAMWEMRNKVVFENKVVQIDGIVKRVRELMREMDELEEGCLQSAEKGKSRVIAQGVAEQRRILGGYEVVVSVDAGVKEGMGMGIGVICRDDTGGVLWGWEERRRQEFEVRVAEVEAVLVGLRWAMKMKHRRVRVETDCKDVIEALQGNTCGRSDFHIVIKEVLDLRSCFDFVTWSHVSRNYNRAAHCLAHSCTLGGGNFLDGSTMQGRSY